MVKMDGWMNGAADFLPPVECSVLQVLRVYLSYLKKLGSLLGWPQDGIPDSFSLTLSFISNLQRAVTPLQERKKRKMLFFRTTITELQVATLYSLSNTITRDIHILKTQIKRDMRPCLDAIPLKRIFGVCWALNNLLTYRFLLTTFGFFRLTTLSPPQC